MAHCLLRILRLAVVMTAIFLACFSVILIYLHIFLFIHQLLPSLPPEDTAEVYGEVAPELRPSVRTRRGIKEAARAFIRCVPHKLICCSFRDLPLPLCNSTVRSFDEVRRPHASPQYNVGGRGLATNGDAEVLRFLAHGGYDAAAAGRLRPR